MFTFHAEQFVPDFILNDRNGYAIAKAIEAAMQIFNDTVEQGIAILTDATVMPEWRLNEVAWEYALPMYAPIPVETKRRWIANAYEQARLYGTPAGVKTFLDAVFDGVQLQEWFDYSGDPYTFRVIVDGEYSRDNLVRLVSGVNEMKSVRSSFETATFRIPEVESLIQMYYGTALYGVVSLDIQDADEPDLDQAFLVDENNVYMLDERGIIMTE